MIKSFMTSVLALPALGATLALAVSAPAEAHHYRHYQSGQAIACGSTRPRAALRARSAAACSAMQSLVDPADCWSAQQRAALRGTNWRITDANATDPRFDQRSLAMPS